MTATSLLQNATWSVGSPSKNQRKSSSFRLPPIQTTSLFIPLTCIQSAPFDRRRRPSLQNYWVVLSNYQFLNHKSWVRVRRVTTVRQMLVQKSIKESTRRVKKDCLEVLESHKADIDLFSYGWIVFWEFWKNSTSMRPKNMKIDHQVGKMILFSVLYYMDYLYTSRNISS